MLLNQTLDQLRHLRLSGMAAAFAEQLEQPELLALSFEERFALLLDREVTQRENRRLNRLLQLARFRQPACVEDIDYKHRRGLERTLMATLVSGDWIRARHNLHLTGPTGTGKSWLACALGHQACRQGLSVRYERVARLLDSLRIARGDGSLVRRLAQIAKTISSSSTTSLSSLWPRASAMIYSKSLKTVMPDALLWSPVNCPSRAGMNTWRNRRSPTPCSTACSTTLSKSN